MGDCDFIDTNCSNHFSFISPIFSSCNGGGGSVKNGRLSVDSEGQPVSQQKQKGKNDSNASASPIPREPFDLAQLKAYGK